MILTSPAELAQFLPNHVMQNLDNLQGFFAISESDFLADRLGRPLLDALQTHYNDMCPVLTTDDIPSDDPIRPWHELALLCQPVVAFDAVARAADIQAVSVNQGGINIAETGGYDIAPDKFIANYKAQCIKEAHAAVNRLLIKLEDWQKQVATATAPVPDASPSGSSDLGTTPPPPLGSGSVASQLEIVTLWQQSAYYYYIEGLLFSTAQQFGSYINIYDSREKFITLVPDIRYCQEVHLEAELGEEFLADLITRFHSGALNKVELKAYRMLQRTLSLYVEARAPMFKARAQQARDEATGHMALTLAYLRNNALIPASPTVCTSGSTTKCSCHCATSPRSSTGFYASSLI